jgi:hypothetical protein
MNFAKRVSMFVGFAVLAAALVSALAPKATHALVAALVQITNTSANPVPTYDAGTRFSAELCHAVGPVSSAYYNCGAQSNGTFVVPLVTSSGATVKHLVVDTVGGYCSSYNDSALFLKSVILTGAFIPDSVPNGNTSAFHYIPIVAPVYSYTNLLGDGILANVPESDYSFGQEVHFSFNPGDTVSILTEYFYPGGGTFDASCVASVEGTLVTQ